MFLSGFSPFFISGLNMTSYDSNQTEAAQLGLTLSLDPIEKFVLSGFLKRFIEYFEAPAMWQTTTSEDRALAKLFNRDQTSGDASSSVTYPFALLRVNSVTKSENRFNLRSLASRGLTVIPTSDPRRSYRVTVLPMEFSIGIKFVTASYKGVTTFANRLLFANHRSFMSFNVIYGRASFTVTTQFDTNISLPLANADLDSVTEYPVEVNATVFGFMSDPVAQEQQNATEIDTTMSVGPSLSPVSSTVFWSFPPS